MSALRSLLVLAALVAAAPALAQTAREVPYQGVLLDGGAPVTTDTDLTFSVFDAASGGTALWTETQTVSPDAEGVFAVRLGAVAALGADLFAGPRWLEVETGAGVLGPRTPLGAAPYAAGLALPLAAEGATPGYLLDVANTEANGWGIRASVTGDGSTDIFGIRGDAAVSGAGNTRPVYGVYGTSSGRSGVGVGGYASDQFGQNRGGDFESRSNSGTGVYATASATSGETYGIRTYVRSPIGYSGSFNGGQGISVRSDSDVTFVDGSSSATVRASNTSGGLAGLFTTSGTNAALLAENDGGGSGIQVETSGSAAALAVDNDGTGIGVDVESSGSGGLNSATVRGLNTSTTSGVAGFFDARGTDAALAVRNLGTGDLFRAFATAGLRFRVTNTGNVYADGSFFGGGADLAEYFPLAPAASVAPGDLVGLRGGRVSLAASGAEQVMIASSDPAFVGNPDAEAGGALVALVGQAEVRISGTANVGDLLVASGYNDGTARAVAPQRYAPEADGPVAGRVISLPEAGRAVALVGVDEAAALRSVVAAQAARLDAQQAQIDALARRLDALTATASAP